MDIQLFVKTKSDGTVRSFKFNADAAVVIGRNPEAVVPLEGSALSRDHFNIQYRDGTIYVTDTSSNGTWVNGELIGRGKSKAVGIADQIEVAGYEMNYKLLATPEKASGQAVAKPGAPAAATSPKAPPVPAWRGILTKVSDFVGPFGGAEKFAVLLIVCAAALTLVYFNS